MAILNLLYQRGDPLKVLFVLDRFLFPSLDDLVEQLRHRFVKSRVVELLFDDLAANVVLDRFCNRAPVVLHR